MLSVIHRLPICTSLQGSLAGRREVSGCPAAEVALVGSGEVEGQFVRVIHRRRAIVSLHRFGHGAVQHPGALEPELTVQRLLNQGVSEVVYNGAGLRPLLQNHVRTQLLQSGQQRGLWETADRCQERVARASANDGREFGDRLSVVGERLDTPEHGVSYRSRKAEVFGIPADPNTLFAADTAVGHQGLDDLLEEERVALGPSKEHRGKFADLSCIDGEGATDELGDLLATERGEAERLGGA